MINLLWISYTEALGGVALLAMLIMVSLSVNINYSARTLKLSGLLGIISLSLFSNHHWTYFAAIFILATTVTEIEFLQNLAAIIRGGENYFDYKKHQMTSQEVLEKIAIDEKVPSMNSPELSDDFNDVEPKIDEPILNTSEPSFIKSPDKSKTSVVMLSRYHAIENKALDWVTNNYNGHLEKHVRFSNQTNSVSFDGVLYRNAGEVTLIEIKYFSKESFKYLLLTKFSRNFDRSIDAHKRITGDNAVGLAILVFDNTELFESDFSTNVINIFQDTKNQITFACITIDDFGKNYNKDTRI